MNTFMPNLANNKRYLKRIVLYHSLIIYIIIAFDK